MKEREYFQTKLQEGAEITVDISETYRNKLNDLLKLFKFAYGQPASDFKNVVDYTFFVTGVPEPESRGKLEVIIEKFITAIRYFSYLGMDEDKINRQLKNFGITISKSDWSPVGGPKASIKKYKKLWSEIFPSDTPMAVDDKLFKFLLNESVSIKSKILSLSTEIEAIGAQVEVECEVSKPSFKKGVSLKAKVLKGKDIGDDVTKIELKADEVSTVLGILSGNEDEDN